MRPRLFLRLFLMGSIVLGIIVAFVIQNLPQPEPIKINTLLIGRTGNDLDAPMEEPTLYEIQCVIDREGWSHGLQYCGTVDELKIEEVSTSFDPPRVIPLIGNASLCRTQFRCTVKLTRPDGSSSREVFLVETNGFRLIGNR